MALGLALLGLALPGIGGCASSPPPHLVLIVIDTLRADHLGAYGYARPTSPTIDALAAEGTLFTRAFAPSSWTRPSMGSLFTSRLPSEHGAVAFERSLRGDLPTLAERLAEAGYHTLGVSGNFVHVSPETGLSRGFADFESLSVPLEGRGDALLRLSEVSLRAPTAREVNRAVSARLPARADRPLFLYVHYMEPHAGYQPPEPFRSAFGSARPGVHRPATSDRIVALARGGPPAPEEVERLQGLYDGEIAAVDAEVGELLRMLEARGFARNAVIALVSDHGEEFGEHGGLFHGITLYRESLAVPLVIHDARHPTRGVRRDDPVDLLDVAPTLLALAGLDPAPGMIGRPLLDGDLPSRDLVAELHADPAFETHLRPRAHALAVVRWPWKLLLGRDGAVSAHALDRDPREQSPLPAEAVPDRLRRVAQALAARSAAADAGQPLELDATSREGLRALGYAE